MASVSVQCGLMIDCIDLKWMMNRLHVALPWYSSNGRATGVILFPSGYLA